IRNPRTRNREVYKKRLEAFYKYFTVLENGFVVFKEEYLEEIIRNLGDFNTLIEKIGKIASELAG
ncbi:MAG: TaqI family restriction endonuclease, partial [bacterium]